MSFTILPVKNEDAVEGFAVADMAFANLNSMLYTTWPLSRESAERLMETRLKLLDRMPVATMFKAVDIFTGRIIGIARWIVEEEDEIVCEDVEDAVEGMMAQAIPETDEVVSRAFYTMALSGKREVLGGIQERMEAQTAAQQREVLLRENMLDIPVTRAKTKVVLPRRVELETIFTHPEFQRHGVATALLQWGIKEAQRLGAMMYLEATEEGRSLYSHNGFQAVKVVNFDATKYAGKGKHTYTVGFLP
ncbi:acyl-CoA N-acyltransferase [Aspergillus californicus]